MLTDHMKELVMEFRVFQDEDHTQIPRGYLEQTPGFMRFMQPLQVEWSEIQAQLNPHGYRFTSDVYYILPGSKPPHGMVLISCEEHVHAMMQVLEGIKKCDLYLVRNYPSSDDSDDDMYTQVDYVATSLILHILSTFIHTYVDTNTFFQFEQDEYGSLTMDC